MGCGYLFFAVSTAFTITAPLVPGSFTYSSFGAGAGGGGATAIFLESAVDGLEAAGGSSERREENAFEIILANRE